MRLQSLLNTVLILGLIVGSSCTTSTLLLQSLEKIKTDDFFINNPLTHDYINTVQLQIQNGGDLAEVIDLVNDLIKDLYKQIDVAEQEWTKKNDEYNNEIKNYKKTIATLNGKIQALEQLIQTTTSQIATTERKLEVIQVQIKLGQAKQNALRIARNNDIQNYNNRTERQEKMVEALTYILSELKNALQSGNFLQVKQALQKYSSQLKGFNRLQALVDLTMTFNKEEVNHCLEKVAQLKSVIEASLEDERAIEKKASEEFTVLDKELTEFLDQSLDDQNKNQQQLAKLNAQLLELKADKKENEGLLEVNTRLLTQTQAAQEAYNKQYEKDQSQRKSEIEVCEKVNTILRANKGNIDKLSKLSFAQQTL